MKIARRPQSTQRSDPPPLTWRERREVGATLRDAAEALLPVAEDEDASELWHLVALLTELHDVVCPGGKYAGLASHERAAARTIQASFPDDDD